MSKASAVTKNNSYLGLTLLELGADPWFPVGLEGADQNNCMKLRKFWANGSDEILAIFTHWLMY